LKLSFDYKDPMRVSVLRKWDGQAEVKNNFVSLKHIILFNFGMQEYYHIVKQKARTSLILEFNVHF